MKPISLDLRQRVLAAVVEGKSTRGEIAERFSVCKSWIRRLLQRLRETGSIASLPPRGGPQPKLTAEHLQRLRELSEAQPDATLDELRLRLGEPVCEMTICRGLKQLQLPLKKSRTTPASKTGPT